MTLHTIDPVYDENSRILILGSFPSVKSRETGFFYGHPQNRFWRVLAAEFGGEIPVTNDEKKAFLLRSRVALWDVAAECEIEGSSDAAIHRVRPNDISPILKTAQIEKIYVNGGVAAKIYDRCIMPEIKRGAVRLPSTSPANASWSFERLCAAWSVIRV